MPTELIDFLQWIVYGGGGAIAASFILEKMSWYNSKPGEVKKNIYFGIVSAFTILMYVIMTYVPVETLEMLAPYFGIIAISFINGYVGTSFHRAAKPTIDTVEVSAALVETELSSSVQPLTTGFANVKVEIPCDGTEIKG